MTDAQIIALFISTIVALSGVVVFLYLRGEKVHKKYVDLVNENHIKHSNVVIETGKEVTKAYTDNAKANEHLANAIDDLKLVVINRKKGG